MPAAVRLGDDCTGHGCFPSRSNGQGSENVNINGIPVHRTGDHWPSHCCGPVCHDSVAGQGSSTVNVNGKPLFRVGDPVECGSNGNSGSPNVNVG